LTYMVDDIARPANTAASSVGTASATSSCDDSAVLASDPRLGSGRFGLRGSAPTSSRRSGNGRVLAVLRETARPREESAGGDVVMRDDGARRAATGAPR